MVVQPHHPGILARLVALLDPELGGDAVAVRNLSSREGVEDRLQRRGRRQDLGAERSVRNGIDVCLAQRLPQSLIVGEEEELIPDDRSAKLRAKLIQAERRDVRVVKGRARVEDLISQVLEGLAVEGVRPGLGNDVDLHAGGPAALGGVDRGADTELLDRIQRDGEPRLSLLRLLLDTGGVDAVKREIVVVERMAVESDVPLATTAVVDRAGREGHQRGPVPPAQRDLVNLGRFDDATDLRRILVQEFRGGLHFDDDIVQTAELQPGVDGSSLADSELNVIYDERLEACIRKFELVPAH